MSEGPSSWVGVQDGRLAALIEIAAAAGQATLQYFRHDSLRIERKADSSPVTAADRGAEQLVRALVAERFPDDAILGEEFEEQPGRSGYRWIVDPIDGTKSFIAGVPLYSTLLALEHQGQNTAGMILIPALGEAVVAARGRGAWYRSAAEAPWSRCQVSSCSRLAEGIFVTSQVDSFADRGAEAAYRQIEATASITRTWGDGYGYLLVATGRAEVMIDAVVNPWDIAAIEPVIDEAGGRFTRWDGQRGGGATDAVGSNGRVHDEVLRMLAPFCGAGSR